MSQRRHKLTRARTRHISRQCRALAGYHTGEHDIVAATRVNSTSEEARVREAIARGVGYLESAQLPSGEIPMDTSPTPDMSDPCVRDPVVFPAALAARALSITPSATRVLARAFDFLVHEMHP